MTKATEDVLGLLDNVKQNGPQSWMGSCPVPGHGQGHGDRNPSLSIKHEGDRVLLNCQSGCHVQDVMLALGIEFRDLFDEPLERGVKVAEWTYQRPDGTPHMIVERIEGKQGKSFLQKVAGAVKYGLGDTKPCLYRMPQVMAAIESRQEIWVVEGEKCVHAALRLGVVATTNPMGAGAWREYMAGWLQDAPRVNIVIDNDEPGRKHAREVEVSLRKYDVPTRVYQVAMNDEKADLYDHVQAGYGLDDLRPIKLNRLRPPGTTLDELMQIEFPPIRWAVRGLLPTGFSILGGPPKQAKSLVALDMALGVAHGGRAMSQLECEQGSVLYLSLDNDSERRLHHRINYLLSDQLDPTRPIEFHTEWPTGDEAITACQEWLDDEVDAGRDPLLIVVDTMGKVEPNFEGTGGNAYLASTANLSRWSKFANDNEVAVLAVHHDRKAGNRKDRDDEDWLDRFTGSRGITATASTLMMLDAKRGEPTGMLRVAGRDIETDDLELHRSGWSWVCLDRPHVEIGV